MKKGVVLNLFVVMVGLLVVGCADPNGGGTTGGNGAAGTGIDLPNAYISTYVDDYYTQWIVDGSTYKQQDFDENVKEREYVYTFEVATDFTGDIYVRYWDEDTDTHLYTPMPLNTTGYTLYKSTHIKTGSLDGNGTWNESSISSEYYYLFEDYYFVKQSGSALQITDLEEIIDFNNIGTPTGDYYISGDIDSTLGEIMGETTYTGSNGTYNNRSTYTDGMSISGNTLTWQSATNGVKYGEYEMRLETISTSPTVYWFTNDNDDNPVLGSTSITATGYTLYKATYTKYQALNEQGGWDDYLSRVPADERDSYAIIKIEGNKMSLYGYVILENGKYYIYTDDINNPVLEPDVYTR